MVAGRVTMPPQRLSCRRIYLTLRVRTELLRKLPNSPVMRTSGWALNSLASRARAASLMTCDDLVPCSRSEAQPAQRLGRLNHTHPQVPTSQGGIASLLHCSAASLCHDFEKIERSAESALIWGARNHRCRRRIVPEMDSQDVRHQRSRPTPGTSTSCSLQPLGELHEWPARYRSAIRSSVCVGCLLIHEGQGPQSDLDRFSWAGLGVAPAPTLIPLCPLIAEPLHLF